MSRLDVYSRRGCHLCDELLEALLPLVRGRLDVVVHDIDSRADWAMRYGMHIPVVEFAGREVCRHALDRAAIAAVLASLQGTQGAQ